MWRVLSCELPRGRSDVYESNTDKTIKGTNIHQIERHVQMHMNKQMNEFINENKIY